MAQRKSRVSIELGVQGAKALRALNLTILQSIAELQRIDSTCNRVDSLSHFSKKIGFREQRIDSHDLRIDSDYHRGQLGSRIDSYVNIGVLIWERLQRIDSAEARVDSSFEIGLERDPVDSSSSESILKFRRFIRTGNPWLGILIPYVFETFQVPVQAWKVAKRVVDPCGLDSPTFESSAVSLTEN
ncbi:hypothetical protein PIB30_050251 [Stylosanthes scabra]|uniref:Uncharacterized protein n=1 Tax=Stylosanthes scabra TaxID=79078 RepID=A0ABU6SIQ1_9FABA|nr:hypothetical protein [Stylosanthes scabra]